MQQYYSYVTLDKAVSLIKRNLYFTKIDLKSTYWHMPIHSSNYTAPDVIYDWKFCDLSIIHRLLIEHHIYSINWLLIDYLLITHWFDWCQWFVTSGNNDRFGSTNQTNEQIGSPYSRHSFPSLPLVPPPPLNPCLLLNPRPFLMFATRDILRRKKQYINLSVYFDNLLQSSFCGKKGLIFFTAYM